MYAVMTCGCASNGFLVNADKSQTPCCVVHECTELAPEVPDLSGRIAICLSCKRERESSFTLAFFGHLGEGSRQATETCGACGYHIDVHQEINPSTKREGITDHAFTPRGSSDSDSFYCGCRGWD
jgi:hypothetical protein